jgi:hypothetical protein
MSDNHKNDEWQRTRARYVMIGYNECPIYPPKLHTRAQIIHNVTCDSFSNCKACCRAQGLKANAVHEFLDMEERLRGGK